MSRPFGKVTGIVGAVVVACAGVVLLAIGPAPATATVGAQAFSAETTFNKKCAVCHAKDGSAKTAKGRKLKVKDIRETIKKQSEDEMIKIAHDGKGSDMDAFGKDYSAAELKALVEYYRGLASDSAGK